MADGFDGLIDDALAFFAELKENNTKEWFEPRKDHYTDKIRKPAEFLAGLVVEDLSRICGRSFKPKVFRIYRDVRFSKDKTPYNAHLHLSWFPPEGEAAPGWFFGAAPDYLFVGMGIPGMQGAALTRFRAAIDREGEALSEALEGAEQAVGATISDWGPAPLKRVPKPYDPDHPHGDLLKRKAFTIGADLPKGWRKDGLVKAIRGQADGLLPVWRWLDGAMAQRVR
ncbi:MAG: DUF2461 domain-containing protein [Pseudomonadota bacterium]